MPHSAERLLPSDRRDRESGAKKAYLQPGASKQPKGLDCSRETKQARLSSRQEDEAEGKRIIQKPLPYQISRQKECVGPKVATGGLNYSRTQGATVVDRENQGTKENNFQVRTSTARRGDKVRFSSLKG